MTPATLMIDGQPSVEIGSAEDIAAALSQLDRFSDKQQVLLARSPKHYVLGQRHGELWSVKTRNGPFWTLQSFNGAGTTDYSALRMRKLRDASGFMEWLCVAFFPPWQSRSLSTQDVRVIFAEFLAEKKFSKPFLGA